MSSSVLVIGSEGGLGKEVVALWKSKDYQVLGLDLIESPVSQCDRYRKFDLLNDSPSAISSWLEGEKLDEVIICAATGYFGEFHEQQNINSLIHINFTAQILLVRELLGSLSKNAKIIFVGSVASHMPTPDYEVYSASKLAIESFVRSWRLEVRDKFDVKIFLPGAMKTEFHQKVGFNPDEKLRNKFAEPQSVAFDLWKMSRKRVWRKGNVAASALLLTDRFFARALDKVFMLKRGLK